MIKRNSSISDILEFLNLPIDTIIFSNKEPNKCENYNGTCVYLEYLAMNRVKLSKAFVEKHNNGDIKIHNKNGPAYIYFYDDFVYVSHYINDKLHRINNPAFIKYNRDGLIIAERYYLKGKFHNSVGPSCRFYLDKRWHNRFYINGVEFSRNRFFERMDRINDKEQ